MSQQKMQKACCCEPPNLLCPVSCNTCPVTYHVSVSGLVVSCGANTFSFNCTIDVPRGQPGQPSCAWGVIGAALPPPPFSCSVPGSPGGTMAIRASLRCHQDLPGNPNSPRFWRVTIANGTSCGFGSFGLTFDELVQTICPPAGAYPFTSATANTFQIISMPSSVTVST